MSIVLTRSVLRVTLPLLLGVVLAGCLGSQGNELVVDDEDGPVPTAAQARTALDEALKAFNNHCIAPAAQGTRASYPITMMNPSSSRPSFEYRQLWALKEVGLLDTSQVETERGFPVHRFALTRKGRRAQYDIAQGRGYRTMFCYAIPRVTRLDSIKAVYTSSPNPLANVWFMYKYRPKGKWAASPVLQETFSGLDPSEPSPTEEYSGEQLLMRVDTAWVDRRLTGYEEPPSRP